MPLRCFKFPKAMDLEGYEFSDLCIIILCHSRDLSSVALTKEESGNPSYLARRFTAGSRHCEAAAEAISFFIR